MGSKTSDCRHGFGFTPDDNGIGQLFRDYGEKYISIYRPNEVEIKLIRSIRVCKTPALGGKEYVCKSCKKTKYVFFGCGNSRCPKCQGIKRVQWQDKLSRRLLRCPYVHMVFTMPHLLNRLARSNPYEVYQCLMRSAWSSLSACAAQEDQMGGRPGAIMVLHTFGSDLKYHVHVHALVTFGGLNTNDEWVWPKRKKKIVAYREMRNTFRSHFLKGLEEIYPSLYTYQSYEDLEKDLKKKSWCVHAEPPTMNSDRIKEYLGKYICRIGLSKKRFKYDELENQVHLDFKDYRNKKDNEAAPIAHKEMAPLVAINQILQHCLPRYFQKCRYVGLHANACKKKCEEIVPKEIRNNGSTIKTMFQILHQLLGLDPNVCDNCGHDQIDIIPIAPDSRWIYTWLQLEPRPRGSPWGSRNIRTSPELRASRTDSYCPLVRF